MAHEPDTVLHDDNPHNPAAWQRVETLAEALGVTARTVRNMVKRGDAERLVGPGRRVYFRAVPPAVEEVGIPGKAEFQEGFQESPSTALVETLQAQLVQLARERAAELERLHEALGTARVEAARFQAQLEAATRDAGRVQAERDELAATLNAERAMAEARLDEERRRLDAMVAAERDRAETVKRQAAMVAFLPWWAWRRRRNLRRELELVTTTMDTPPETRPALPTPPRPPRTLRPATVG